MLKLKKAVSLTLLVSGMALAADPPAPEPQPQPAPPTQVTVVLPDGTVVKAELPGALRGNPRSDRPEAEKKVYICHATSATQVNGYLIIHTGKPALDAHLAHDHASPQSKGQGNGNGQNKHERDKEARGLSLQCKELEGS